MFPIISKGKGEGAGEDEFQPRVSEDDAALNGFGNTVKVRIWNSTTILGFSRAQGYPECEKVHRVGFVPFPALKWRILVMLIETTAVGIFPVGSV